MVRTKADLVSTKAMGGKAPAKVSASGKSSDKKSKSNGRKSYGGKSSGNPYHPRKTPEWQKPITSFINTSSGTTSTNDNASVTEEKIENQTSNSNCEDLDAEESTTEEED